MEKLKLIGLFGPPGVGKTQIVHQLAVSEEVMAIDFEVYYPETRGALEMLKGIDRHRKHVVICGAADLHPKDFDLSVLLLPPFDVYMARQKERTTRMPEKEGQQPEKVYRLFAKSKKSYDFVWQGIKKNAFLSFMYNLLVKEAT